MTMELARRALTHWAMPEATIRLAAARENTVYEVTDGPTRMALRLHRPGYRTDRELQAELDWMAATARGGLSVPAPIPTRTGALLIHVDGVQIDALGWLSGQTLTKVLPTKSASERLQLFTTLGQSLARLHLISDAWQPPTGFERVHWNRDGLLGDTPVWDQFWRNPALSPQQQKLFESFREAATTALMQLGETLDYGLIHADLAPDNVLCDGPHLNFIDFDDGGFGYRLFDIATALIKHRASPSYPDLQTALIKGYTAIRSIDLSQLNLFMAIRAVTYVGWNIRRRAETGGEERNQRFIRTADALVSEYLNP